MKSGLRDFKLGLRDAPSLSLHDSLQLSDLLLFEVIVLRGAARVHDLIAGVRFQLLR